MELTFKELNMEEKYPIVIPLKDMILIMNQLNESAYVLYHYLHSKGMRWKWDNINIAKDLSWTTRKVETYKRKLKDAGWIDYWSNKGNKYMYLSKKAVQQSIQDKKEL